MGLPFIFCIDKSKFADLYRGRNEVVCEYLAFVM